MSTVMQRSVPTTVVISYFPTSRAPLLCPHTPDACHSGGAFSVQLSGLFCSVLFDQAAVYQR
jgi:hypothetical protein